MFEKCDSSNKAEISSGFFQDFCEVYGKIWVDFLLIQEYAFS